MLTIVESSTTMSCAIPSSARTAQRLGSERAVRRHRPRVQSGVQALAANGASRTRTGDLLGAIQALSQLSYSPVAGPW